MTRHVAGLLALTLLAGCAAEPEPAPPARPRERAIPDPGPPAPTDDVAGTPLDAWSDETRGELATLVYVTEMGRRDEARAAAIVFSSDPGNAHFHRRSTARVTVQRLTRAEMSALLADVGKLGFDALPWSEQPYDAEIGPQRALYLYRGGRRVRVEKDALPGPARQQFTEIERRLIEASLKGVSRG